MPRADTSGQAKQRLFVCTDFVYDDADNHYVCPAGHVLTKSGAVGQQDIGLLHPQRALGDELESSLYVLDP
jgi:hypothetical protein